jgi:hypothetical protein
MPPTFSKANSDSGGCTAYWCAKCNRCPRFLVFCAGNPIPCVCDERCPICCKPVLFAPKKYWVISRLIAKRLFK